MNYVIVWNNHLHDSSRNVCFRDMYNATMCCHEKWKSFNLNFDVKVNLQSPKIKEILLVVTSIVLILTCAQLNALGFVDACAYVCLITNCCKCTMLLCVVVKNEKRLVWVLIWNLTYRHLK